MLIENTLACSRFVGSLHLLPGVNEVTPEAWERNTAKCKKTIDALTSNGELVLMGLEEKEAVELTPALVKKTYSVDLLETWLTDAKGSLKKAINKQLKVLTAEESLGA